MNDWPGAMPGKERNTVILDIVIHVYICAQYLGQNMTKQLVFSRAMWVKHMLMENSQQLFTFWGHLLVEGSGGEQLHANIRVIYLLYVYPCVSICRFP